MAAVLTTGHGGFEMLEYRTDVPVPKPGSGQVLIKVAAAEVNNTDINTRIGWYAKTAQENGSWSGQPLKFPLIQGAGGCGCIVGVGDGVDPNRIGQRVIVATMQRAGADGSSAFATATLGSEMDGMFAQYMVNAACETFSVDSDWSDAELGSVSCAASTAENMLERVGVAPGDRVLITGASGGVGSAAIQLAARRGAVVVAVANPAKADTLVGVGASVVVGRGDSLVAALGAESIDVVVDVVAGAQFAQLLDVLVRGGRYIASGAIAGPMVELDMRTLYLKDLTLMGATYQQPGVFENLVGYIERNEIRPMVHATYPLSEIVLAQTDFLAKDFVGKLVLLPPE